MKSVTWQQLAWWFTNRTNTATTAAGLSPEPFRKVIWCSGSSRIKLTCKNYPTLGRALCGQQKSEQWIILPYRCSRPQGLTHIIGGDPPAMEYFSSSALLHLSHRLLWCTYFYQCIYYDECNKAGTPDNSGPLSFHLWEYESLLSLHTITWGLPSHWA